MKSVEVWDVKKRGKGGNEKSRVLMLRELGDLMGVGWEGKG